jgi:hypothetical protein
MITVKKHSIIITIHAKEPVVYLSALNRTLLNTNRRMLNSDDLFNDPDTVTDIDNLMLLKEELSVGDKRSKKKKK